MRDLIEFALRVASETLGRRKDMPGNPRYQPEQLLMYLAYGTWATWLVIVEWMWLLFLAKKGIMPEEDAKHLTKENFAKVLAITTSQMDKVEDKLKHDILALLQLMRAAMPEPLHKWLHYSLTSYDVISTAYSLQYKYTFNKAFVPMILEVDELWRQRIAETAEYIQMGRTHIQHALPITAGFWLASAHARFFDNVSEMARRNGQLLGKFSGAVGSKAAGRVLISQAGDYEEEALKMMGVAQPRISTQIPPPEAITRFLFESYMLSGSLAQLGEDIRILQAPEFGEVLSASSSSSTMAHKKANPIAGENIAGMQILTFAELCKPLLNLVSDLQRDLRNSCVMRDYSAILVYVFQQLKTAKRIFKSFKFDHERARVNFEEDMYVVMAELMHLALQHSGLKDSHQFVNKLLIPQAKMFGDDLATNVELIIKNGSESPDLQLAWEGVDENIKKLMKNPEKYIGDCVKLAKKEAERKLRLTV